MLQPFFVILFISTVFSCTDAPGSPAKKVNKKIINTAAGVTKLDTAITGLKIATTLNDTNIIFTAHGKEDAENIEPTTGFFIKGFSGMDYKSAERNLQEFAYSRTHNENIATTENESIKVYNTPMGKAISIIITLKYKNNKTAVATTATVSNGKNAILFIGEDYTNGGFTDKFKSTFDSIEF